MWYITSIYPIPITISIAGLGAAGDRNEEEALMYVRPYLPTYRAGNAWNSIFLSCEYS